MDYKRYIAQHIKAEGVAKEELEGLIAVPPDTSMGDYALPCFKLAKVLRKCSARAPRSSRRTSRQITL